jgi:hypothetical protein
MFCCATLRASIDAARLKYACRTALVVEAILVSRVRSAISRDRSEDSRLKRSLSILKFRNSGWLNPTEREDPMRGLKGDSDADVVFRLPCHDTRVAPVAPGQVLRQRGAGRRRSAGDDGVAFREVSRQLIGRVVTERERRADERPARAATFSAAMPTSSRSAFSPRLVSSAIVTACVIDNCSVGRWLRRRLPAAAPARRGR